jgi:hypothetical protein
MRQIIFTHTGHNVIVGNFAAGDTARLSDDLAKHFVEEACCAQYDEGQAAEPVQQQPKAEQKPAAPAKKGGKK